MITFGWSVKPAGAFTIPNTLPTWATRSRLPAASRIAASNAGREHDAEVSQAPFGGDGGRLGVGIVRRGEREGRPAAHMGHDVHLRLWRTVRLAHAARRSYFGGTRA